MEGKDIADMNRLLITGGAGFIGSNFVHFWVDRHPEDTVVVLDALTYAGNIENLEGIQPNARYQFIRGDINDLKLLDEIFERQDINIVVHFAAESHVDRAIIGPKDFIRTNINGTFVLLETVRKFWSKDPSQKVFVHISTDEVYGSLDLQDPPFTEESPYRPNNPYSASKAASDHLARSYYQTYGLPIIITHCSNNYGPYQFPEKLIPLMIINALERRPLPVYGKGENIRDWIYVEDHCRALELVIKNGRAGEVYNIGGNNELRNIDIVRQICKMIDDLTGNKDTDRLIRFVADRPGHDLRYAIDTTKIRTELGWRPKESFDTGLEKTIKWYIDNRSWWERVRTGEYQKYYGMQYGNRIDNLR